MTARRSVVDILAQGRPRAFREATIGVGFFLACVALVQAVDILNTPFNYYDALTKPSYAPSAWVFSPVWTLLWIFTAAAAVLVWRRVGLSGGKLAFGLWFTHLIGNVLWTVLFFRLRALEWSAFEICLLTIVVLGAVIEFWRIRPVAGALLLPLLAWLFFASNVTLRIAELN